METKIRQSTKQNAFQASAFIIQQRAFMAHVRTLQFLKFRLKDIDDGEAVHISQKEIEDRYFKYPDYPRKENLDSLIGAGELEISEESNPSTDHIMKLYRVINPEHWKLDLRLLKPREIEYGTQMKQMQQHLMSVTLPIDTPSTPYFDFFLKNRIYGLDYFFMVDTFSGRVHTPVTSFSRTLRPNILLNGSETVAFDVATMQPLLLGKILKEQIGTNEFSHWIDSGEDIYLKLQQVAGLQDREQAKKRFYEITYSKPNDSLANLFGDSEWIKWVNDYKRNIVPENPHNKENPHTNLAWLLQTTEVQTMSKVWQALIDAGIIFLTVHDEIIVREQDRHQAESLFRKVFNQEFTFYKLNVPDTTTTAHCLNKPNTPPQKNLSPQVTAASPEAANTTEPKHQPTTPTKKPQLDDWNNEISDLENYFASIVFPNEPIKLNRCSTIIGCLNFIDSHLRAVKFNNSNPAFLPYLHRLRELRQILTIIPN